MKSQEKITKKKTKSFGGNFWSMEKKSLPFLLSPTLIKIYTMGFGRKDRLSGK